MSSEEKFAKLLALSILYQKNEIGWTEQVQRITCSRKDVDEILEFINDDEFKGWVRSVSHLFKSS